MADRVKNVREKLIRAGIEEINARGITKFSVRRVAEKCKVSCSAPYKHFKNKQEFITAIIEFVGEQWYERRQEILERCGDSPRSQLVEVSVGYISFFMEKPFFRSILLLKDEQLKSLLHKTHWQIFSLSPMLLKEYFDAIGWNEGTLARKKLLVRAMIFGSIVMFDSGELPYNEQTLEHIRFSIDREFDLP